MGAPKRCLPSRGIVGTRTGPVLLSLTCCKSPSATSVGMQPGLKSHTSPAVLFSSCGAEHQSHSSLSLVYDACTAHA